MWLSLLPGQLSICTIIIWFSSSGNMQIPSGTLLLLQAHAHAWLFLSSGFSFPSIDSSGGSLSKFQTELIQIDRTAAFLLVLDFLDCNHSFNPTPSVAPTWQTIVKGAGHSSLFFLSFLHFLTPRLAYQIGSIQKKMWLVLTLTVSRHVHHTMQ